MLLSFFSFFLDPTISVVAFLVVVSILVLAHEFGHFLLARLLKVGVEEFAIGLPLTQPLWTLLRRDGLRISIYPALFGGFVRLLGEEGPEKPQIKEKKGAQFWSQPLWVRFLVIVAGVVANAVLATLAFSTIVFFSGIPTKVNTVKVIEVAPNSPAAKVGILPGDVIVGVEALQKPKESGAGQLIVGQAVTTVEGFIKFVNSLAGKTVEIEVKRGGKTLRLDATPRVSPPKGEGALGVAITDVEKHFPPLPQRVFESLKLGVQETWFWTKLTVKGAGTVVWQLITTGKLPSDVAGPVGIAEISGRVVKEGALTFLEFLGILSINLAVINILPFPALDGGRVLFLAVEGLFGRRVAPKVEHWVHTLGMVILLTLMLLITLRDIERIVRDSGLLKNGLKFR